MSTEENKALARRWAEEIFNQGNLDAADELYGPGFITRYLDAPDPDREGWKEFSRPFISGFSERRLAVEGLVSEGEEVVARVRFSGRHTGRFFGIHRPIRGSSSPGWYGSASPKGRSSNTGASSTPWP